MVGYDNKEQSGIFKRQWYKMLPFLYNRLQHTQ